MQMTHRVLISSILFGILAGVQPAIERANAAEVASTLSAGFGKQDITPTVPVRLSGYASRNSVLEGVRDRLFARCMAIGPADANRDDASQVNLVISIEGLAVTATQTKAIADAVQRDYGIARAQVVVCSTHSHAAPHAFGAIPNLFRQPLGDEELAALKEYTAVIHTSVMQTIATAIGDLKPAEISMGDGRADFAVNRRVLTGGLWSGFGVTPDGPTDRRVRILKAVDVDGTLLGATFQYACHCTTLGPSFNEVSGDWAGLAALELEAKHSDAVFVPVIGCGADANPEPRDAYSWAVQHGKAMASAVEAVLQKKEMTPVQILPKTRFGYAGLSSERPTKASLKELLTDSNVNNRNWAALMLQTWEDKGRLPESYPAPIHIWAFGDQLAWVFLGGEVVVDYQIRLEQELDGFGEVWVAAYTDDCFAYVASERMRDEGGYEVDFSMIYYGQPGRWESGTEDLLVRRVKEIFASDEPDAMPKSPDDSLAAIRVPEGFHVSLVAAEPLVQDPINIAFANDGSVWVVEMADYPLGVDGGGRVKRLFDSNGDGRLDHAEVFLTGLSYPTSVMPWRDGVLVIAAPDVLFARDTDGDGVADQTEVLLSGIGEANPQHRASGFEWGLDGYVYFGAGEYTKTLVSHRSGESIITRGGDVRWNPDTGEVRKVAGKTQFLRSRDRWGRWFGNSNSQPLFHYRVDDPEANQRNPDVESSRLVLQPGVAPPVFPRSRIVDRFNDLFAKQRFTSACGSIVMRGAGLGEEMLDVALICEPVHNLVARFALSAEDDSIRGDRLQEDVDTGFDWLASSDTWFRPVRTIEAPDGSIWVVDMYRRVIEHPEWIPDAWQQQIDLRSGSDAGRIFRVRRDDAKVPRLPSVAEMDVDGLVSALVGQSATVRDLAMQRLVWERPDGVASKLRSEFANAKEADIRLQVFATLVTLEVANADDWQAAFSDTDARVVAWVAKAAASHEIPGRYERLSEVVDRRDDSDPDLNAAKFQALLTIASLPMSKTETTQLADSLRNWVGRDWRQSWFLDGMSLFGGPQASIALTSLADSLDELPVGSITDAQWNQLESVISALWRSSDEDVRRSLLAERLKNADTVLTTTASSPLLLTLAASSDSDVDDSTKQLIRKTVTTALKSIGDDQLSVALRLRAAKLLGTSSVKMEDQVVNLEQMLSVEQPAPIRVAALTAAYRVDCDETADVLIDAWPYMIPSERTIAGRTLLQRTSWTRTLADGLVAKRIRLADLDPSTLSDLQNCRDYGVMKKVGTLIQQPTSSERDALVKDYLKQVGKHTERSGEFLSRGRRLYQDNCAACHDALRVPGKAEQPAIGPALANLKSWKDGQWVTAILDPNANVEPKHRQYRLLTDSGQVLAGRVLDQAGDTILLGMADGRRVEVERSELESMEDSGVSLMPEGFEAKLTAIQMAELIGFLRSL